MSDAVPKTTGCRVCGNTEERLRRGLCQRHYRRFSRKLATLTPDEAVAFEARCLEEGWVEPKRQGRRSKIDDDPFDEMVAEIRDEFATDLAPHIAAEKKRQAQEEAVEQAKTAKKRSTKRKAE